ncbi:hypothetical protein, partial [Actinosynnema sp.]|uniref:hypothetical protein n=1 Tax=Actinosynnema sp. TaxID=1872144 RepID=UPI003F83107A
RGTLRLRLARALHTAHGYLAGPVAGTGALDGAWFDRTTGELERAGEEQARATAARVALTAAGHRAHALARFCLPTEPAGITLESLAAAQQAVKRWQHTPDGAAELADHLAAAHPDLVETCEALRDEAATALSALDSAWTPLAGRLSTWVALREEADRAAERVAVLKSATEWLKGNADGLRAQRLRPYAEQARSVWSQLRQESAVDLGEIALEGTATNRRVELKAQVDGEPAGALSVMSQGELHALALALFIPRATSPRSPFQFVVLDDPVQAMDPAKVDGFARLLAGIARTHQVVVFSHDDRLPEAVRGLNLPGANIVEITRAAGSEVVVRPSYDPVERYVSDACALVKDSEVTEDLKADVLPLLCRLAVEAAARRVHYARRLAAGCDRLTAEREWESRRRTRDRVSLVSPDRWSDAKPYRNRTLGVCGSGVHDGAKGRLLNIVEDLRDTVRDLLAVAP